MDFMDNRLFRRTLAPQPSPDPHAESREHLLNALLQMRERAKMLASEIHRDLPDFTVHDITHLDALWEMADLIAGPDYPLNPLEAFALGAVFLLHDLGLGLAAWPGGLTELKKGPGWQDALSTYLRKHLGRIPTKEELASPPSEVERMAIRERLRVLHAERAERLALTSWSYEGGPEYHLIEDPDLRKEVGFRLGRIAHSHWWPVSRLASEFSTIRGALLKPPCSPDWTLDPLKIAVLLRTADAAHLDSRRAPGFLMAVRRPEGVSEDHWRFQNRLSMPRIPDDRLIYTTSNPFLLDEVNAWWLCEETLRMVDRELHQVDALLYDMSRPRLRAKGVAGIETPNRLQKYIEVSGWTPVDARLHVSNVADLARKMGGEQLYGNDPTIPLRELIQNAADSVRARRLLKNYPYNWGRITVRLGRDEQGPWVEVEDSGIGMSEAVLTGPLLDFGTTYWGSGLMREEHEGLWAKGFEPTGCFGIGFFSVFMWGNQVRVTTRKYDDGPRDTRILEFRRGLESRPLVRPAKAEEQLEEAGTRVRVWLEKDPLAKGGLLWPSLAKKPVNLGSLCSWLAPALDVTIYVDEPNAESRRVLDASDWLTITAAELQARLSLNPVKHDTHLERSVREIKSNRRTLGRASIFHGDVESFPHDPGATGVITVGGLRVKTLSSVVGIIIGSTKRAARNDAEALDPSSLASWASEQASIVSKLVPDPIRQMYYAASILALGGDTAELPIARYGELLVNRHSLESLKEAPDEIIFHHDEIVMSREQIREVQLLPNVVIGCASVANWEFGATNILPEILQTILARIWQCSPKEIEPKSSNVNIGVDIRGTVFGVFGALIFRRPYASKAERRRGKRRLQSRE